MNDYADRLRAIADETEADPSMQASLLGMGLQLMAIAYEFGMIAPVVGAISETVQPIHARMQRLADGLDEAKGPEAKIMELLKKKEN